MNLEGDGIPAEDTIRKMFEDSLIEAAEQGYAEVSANSFAAGLTTARAYQAGIPIPDALAVTGKILGELQE